MPKRDGLSFSILLLTGVLATWLGIAGPVFHDVALIGFWEWVSKWQTLIGAFTAIFAAFIAARPVWSQLAEMAMQRQMSQLEHLRKRSVEIEKEINFIFSLTSSGQNLAEAIAAIAGSSSNPSAIEHAYNMDRAQSAQRVFDDAIHQFMNEAGPAWGDAETQSNRRSVIENAQMYSVATNNFFLRGPPPPQVTRSAIEGLAAQAAPHKARMVEASVALHNKLIRERARVGEQIARFESQI